MKKVILTVLSVFLLTGCTVVSQEAETTASATAASTEEVYDDLAEYTDLEYADVFTVGTHTTVENMLNHGTGVLVFSFPGCPWCQAYIPMLAEEANTAGVDILYYNIKVDRTEDHDWYSSIAALLDEKDSTITKYNNDGEMLIYMPLVLFIEDGEVVAYDNETCDLDSDEISPEDYWTDEKKEALHTRLAEYLADAKEAIEAGETEGCAVKADSDGDCD